MVTEQTFMEYRNKYIFTHTYGGGRKELLRALCDGFYSLLPKQFIRLENSIFISNIYQTNLVSSDDLQQLIGDVVLDVEEWYRMTNYKNCDQNTKEVFWFWEFIRSSSEEIRRLVLKFVTGSSMLPIGGFKYLQSEKIPFTIEILNRTGLPSARSCVYTLSLSTVDDRQKFFENLTLAIQDCDSFTYV